MKELTNNQKKYLKSEAHHLSPVVMIGQDGLKENVLREIENSINHHELIKVRVLGDDRKFREELYKTICESLSIHPVQHIGKILILYKPAETPVIVFPKEIR